MTYSPNHTASLITFTGEDSADRMQQVMGVVQELGGRAIGLAGSDAEWLGLSGEDLERQRSLDVPIRDVVLNIADADYAVELCDGLNHSGVETLRDVLVLGKWRTSYLSRGMNAVVCELLDQAMFYSCPNDLWRYEPSAADVAKLCIGLDQVHAGVLPTYLPTLNRTRPYPAWERVSDFMEAEPPSLLYYRGGEYYETAHREAVRFAAEFIAAKGR